MKGFSLAQTKIRWRCSDRSHPHNGDVVGMRRVVATTVGKISTSMETNRVRMMMMNAHFFLAIGLILFAFSLCYWFRNEK